MAIPATSSCNSSFPYFHSLRLIDKYTLPSNSKPFSPLHSSAWAILSFTSTTVHSSASSPSPIMEQASPALPMAEFIHREDNPEDCLVQNHNKVIHELLRNPSTEELAMEFYQKAKQNPVFRPQKSTVKSLLKFLVRSKRWDLISSMARDIKEQYQVFPDKATSAWLIGTCLRARKFRVVDSLLEAFQSGKSVDLFHVFDAAMRGYNKLHMYNSTIAIYGRLKLAAGISVLDPAGYLPIMEAYMKLGNSVKVSELFKELEANRIRNLYPNPSDHDPLIYTQVYGILIEALGRSGEPFRALNYFEKMVDDEGISPNASIYSSLIGFFADTREVEVAERLMEEAQGRRGIVLKDPAMFMKLVSMYVDKGLVEKNLNVVKIMQAAKLKVSDCIFSGIINGFANKRGPRAAADVYEALISPGGGVAGIEPGQVTYASILNIYHRLELYTRAQEIFTEMLQRGFDKCLVAYSTMVVMYGKTGNLKQATKLVAHMKARGCEPNVWIYNALIDLHGRERNLRQVEKIWKEMKRNKVGPDRITYTSSITAYSMSREYEKCVHLYKEFRLNGGVTDLAMAGIMVGVLSKLSRIDELVKLLRDIKAQGMKLDLRLYRSALNAFRDAGLQLQVKWLKESFDFEFDHPAGN
ncbi:hypothetical protein Dimus_000150 [Dionaea muscipula]